MPTDPVSSLAESLGPDVALAYLRMELVEHLAKKCVAALHAVQNAPATALSTNPIAIVRTSMITMCFKRPE